LRESYRKNGKVQKRTLCNLSDWPAAHIDGLRGVLKGGTVIPADRDAFTITRSLPLGHVAAARGTARKIGLDRIFGPEGNRCCDLVLAMLVSRILDPASKLATARALSPDTASFIFVCKPASHPLLEEYLTRIGLPVLEQTIKRGKQRFVHRYRWLADVPLRAGNDAMTVNWFAIEIINPNGETTYRNSFVTHLAVGSDTVVELAACRRARWKIENETFNVLKNKGYNLEHSVGHGKQNLAAILVSLNLLAFAFHTVCNLANELWRNARAKLGPRYNFFSKLAAITIYLIFPSWDDLLLTLGFAKPPPIPP
jgi:hypothetical protein